MAVLAPIPSVSVRNATPVNPGVFVKTRAANRTSCQAPRGRNVRVGT